MPLNIIPTRTLSAYPAVRFGNEQDPPKPPEDKDPKAGLPDAPPKPEAPKPDVPKQDTLKETGEKLAEGLQELLDKALKGASGQIKDWDPAKAVDEAAKAIKKAAGDEASKKVEETLKGDPKPALDTLKEVEDRLNSVMKALGELVGPQGKDDIEKKKDTVLKPVIEQLKALTLMIPALPMALQSALAMVGNAAQITAKTLASQTKDPNLKELLNTLGDKGKDLANAANDQLKGKQPGLFDILGGLVGDLLKPQGGKGSSSAPGGGLGGLLDVLKNMGKNAPKEPPASTTPPAVETPQVPPAPPATVAPTPAEELAARIRMELGPQDAKTGAIANLKVYKFTLEKDDARLAMVSEKWKGTPAAYLEAMELLAGITDLEKAGYSKTAARLKVMDSNLTKENLQTRLSAYATWIENGKPMVAAPQKARMDEATKYGVTPEEYLAALKELSTK